MYSNSVEARRDETIYLQDPKDGYEIDVPPGNSKVVDKFLAYIQAVGFDLSIEYEGEDEDVDYSMSDSLPDKYPKFLKEADYN